MCGVIEKLLSPSTLEEVSHAQVLQSVNVNLFGCPHDAGGHGREGFEARRTSHLTTSDRLLSELVVKPDGSLH